MAVRDESTASVGAEPPALPKYVLSRAIARGGMGSVHLAHAATSSGEVADGAARPLAIKRMHAHLGANANFRAMFMDEAWLTRHIRHPNIVAIHETIEHHDELFLVMEYIHGDSLARLARGVRMPPAIASAILCDVLRGLQAAHDAQDTNGAPLSAVHRDVSPQNILVGTDGRARIIDFGIAKFTSQLHHTTQGRIRGKLRYLAPEQVLATNVTHRTDLFAFGLLAFELFSGAHPLAALTGEELIAAVVAARFPTLESVAPELPRELSMLIGAALARSPSRRPDSANAILDELSRVVPCASAEEVSSWLATVARDALEARSRMLEELCGRTDEERTVIDERSLVGASARFARYERFLTPPPRRRRFLAFAALTSAGIVTFIAAMAQTKPGTAAPVPARLAVFAPVAEPVSNEPPQVIVPAPQPALTSPKRSARPTTAPARTGSTASLSACDPPYTVDERLHKHYRPECLRSR